MAYYYHATRAQAIGQPRENDEFLKGSFLEFVAKYQDIDVEQKSKKITR
jgi:hypothetical protein